MVPSSGIQVSSAEFEKWMKRHNLSPNQAAEYLDIDRKTIDRYHSRELMIPQRVWMACRALDPMHLWRLTPIGDREHNDWRASSYQGPVIVRAQDKTLARWHAATMFHVVARRRSTDKESPEPPWLSARRVKADEIESSEPWLTNGNPGVLSHLVVNRAFLSPYTSGLDEPEIRRIVEHRFVENWGRHDIDSSLELTARGGVIELNKEVDGDLREQIRNSVQKLLAEEEGS